jgi:hypothetical protein
MPDRQRTISVALTAAQWNLIGAALNELPRRVSDEVYRAIEAQLMRSPAKMPPEGEAE